MLPKCVLQASLHYGCQHKPHSIEELCRLWSDDHLASLWRYASGHGRKTNSKSSKEQTRETDMKVQPAVSKAREGLLPTLLRLGECYSRSTSGVQSHNLLKSHYPQKFSSCLQTLTSCLFFVNFLDIVLVAPQDCECST